MKAKKVLFVYLSILTFFSSFVFASSFILNDINDDLIKDQIIEVSYAVNNVTFNKLYITNSSGYLNIELPKNYSNLTFLLRNEGKTYFAKVNDYAASARLVPIAKISGFIIDERDNLLKHAMLRIYCSSAYSGIPATSDDIGFFEIEKVGLGNCEINVIREGKIKS